MNGWLVVADQLLAAGFTARLTRLIVADDLGKWWVQQPVDQWLDRRHWTLATMTRWRQYLDGLTCPFCVGFWCAGAVLLSLALVGGPGDAAHWWRYVAGWFSLNWVVAHVGVRLGDAGYDD